MQHREVVKLLDFICGYIAGMIITVLTIMFFMGAGQSGSDV